MGFLKKVAENYRTNKQNRKTKALENREIKHETSNRSIRRKTRQAGKTARVKLRTEAQVAKASAKAQKKGLLGSAADAITNAFNKSQGGESMNSGGGTYGSTGTVPFISESGSPDTSKNQDMEVENKSEPDSGSNTMLYVVLLIIGVIAVFGKKLFK